MWQCDLCNSKNYGYNKVVCKCCGQENPQYIYANDLQIQHLNQHLPRTYEFAKSFSEELDCICSDWESENEYNLKRVEENEFSNINNAKKRLDLSIIVTGTLRELVSSFSILIEEPLSDFVYELNLHLEDKNWLTLSTIKAKIEFELDVLHDEIIILEDINKHKRGLSAQCKKAKKLALELESILECLSIDVPTYIPFEHKGFKMTIVDTGYIARSTTDFFCVAKLNPSFYNRTRTQLILFHFLEKKSDVKSQICEALDNLPEEVIKAFHDYINEYYPTNNIYRIAYRKGENAGLEIYEDCYGYFSDGYFESNISNIDDIINYISEYTKSTLFCNEKYFKRTDTLSYACDFFATSESWEENIFIPNFSHRSLTLQSLDHFSCPLSGGTFSNKEFALHRRNLIYFHNISTNENKDKYTTATQIVNSMNLRELAIIEEILNDNQFKKRVIKITSNQGKLSYQIFYNIPFEYMDISDLIHETENSDEYTDLLGRSPNQPNNISKEIHYITEKEKCKILRSLRSAIARENGIEYNTTNCTFEGKCKGVCKKCYQEIRQLEDKLTNLAKSGKSIYLYSLLNADHLDSIEVSSCGNNKIAKDEQIMQYKHTVGQEEQVYIRDYCEHKLGKNEDC